MAFEGTGNIAEAGAASAAAIGKARGKKKSDMRTEGLDVRKAARAPKGRKDAEGQEAVTRPQVVSERIDELVNNRRNTHSAQEIESEAIKKCAVDSGYNASAIRTLVAARYGDSFPERKRAVDQQYELFSEVGG